MSEARKLVWMILSGEFDRSELVSHPAMDNMEEEAEQYAVVKAFVKSHLYFETMKMRRMRGA